MTGKKEWWLYFKGPEKKKQEGLHILHIYNLYFTKILHSFFELDYICICDRMIISAQAGKPAFIFSPDRDRHGPGSVET